MVTALRALLGLNHLPVGEREVVGLARANLHHRWTTARRLANVGRVRHPVGGVLLEAWRIHPVFLAAAADACLRGTAGRRARRPAGEGEQTPPLQKHAEGLR